MNFIRISNRWMIFGRWMDARFKLGRWIGNDRLIGSPPRRGPPCLAGPPGGPCRAGACRAGPRAEAAAQARHALSGRAGPARSLLGRAILARKKSPQAVPARIDTAQMPGYDQGRVWIRLKSDSRSPEARIPLNVSIIFDSLKSGRLRLN